jgi:uncharacterized membrane protein
MNKIQEAVVRDSKVFALLSYLSILCIIPLIFKKDDDFVLFHSRQGLVLFIAQVGVFILSIVFPWILKIGMFILLAASFIGILAVLDGRRLELPVVFTLSQKIIL